MTALMLVALLMNAEARKPSPATNVTFGEGDVIEGKLDGPDLGVIETYKPPKFGSLIKVRKNFDDKIVRSVDQM
jgi:hypothetical protein